MAEPENLTLRILRELREEFREYRPEFRGFRDKTDAHFAELTNRIDNLARLITG